jgi:predicted nucleic acid-binding protein
MALSGPLQGATRIALDASLFIYLIEKNPTFFAKVEPLFREIDSGAVRGVTSVLALLEVLVRPIEVGATALADDFRNALRMSPNLDLVPMDAAIADLAAGVRARHGFRTPDAIHLATALHVGADAFVTNDARLAAFTDLPVVTLTMLP